ncbi:hypothetical protein K3495_g13832 [Podosphaera aphanis]|nr:hypothetical protein K3495_g13832 [Podosphaera aphanis]
MSVDNAPTDAKPALADILSPNSRSFKNESDTKQISNEIPRNENILRKNFRSSWEYDSKPPLTRHQTTEKWNPDDYQQSVIPMARAIADLMKIYQNDKKYGDGHDILDSKLEIFYDYCDKLRISEDQFSSAFSTMLKGRASNYYYQHLRGRDYTFVQMVNMTRSHFETEEFRQEYLTKWRETTLTRVIRDYPDKSKLECLQIVIDELQRIQQGLSPDYQRENNLRDQLLNACRGIKECNMALFNPARSFEGLCSRLLLE